jgi:multidrug transporter EmrE-like cation transporter
MTKLLTLVLIASMVNALLGIMWRKLIAVTPYTAPLALAGFSVCVFGVIATLCGGQPLIAGRQYHKLWPLAVMVVIVPIFYIADSNLLKRMAFSRVYPLVAVGTITAALILDAVIGEEKLTLRKFVGVLMAILSVWLIRGK